MEAIYERRTDEVLLDWKTASGKRGHFREETLWSPCQHRVIRRTTGAVKRFWGVKTLKPQEEVLELPEEIVTEEQVVAYVRKYKRHWIGRRSYDR